jgi:hypothetical protein
MRVLKVFSAVLVAGVLAYYPVAAQPQQDADRKVAGGGITVTGWTGKEDAGNRQGLTVKDGKFAPEGGGFRLTTGPAAIYWNPANVGKGDFTVKATFTEPKQTYDHAHPFGVFIGGSTLDTAPTALYCTAYRNGTYIVRGFSSGKPFRVVAKPVPHDAIKKAETTDSQVVQDVALRVAGDKVECLVNGASVWSGTKADVTGDGKLASTDGIVGIRVSHNSDAIVTNFAVTK